MPLTYESSDVYIEERDLSGVATPAPTSIGAQVFASRKGPLGRFKVTSVDNFRAVYGNPDASISFGHYTGIAFLSEAQELWCNRVVGAGATYGGVVLQKRQTNPVDAMPVLRGFTVSSADNLDFSTAGAAASTFDNLLGILNFGPGSYSTDTLVEIVSSNLLVPTGIQAADFSSVGVVIAGVPTAGSIQAGSYGYTVTAFNAVGETLASSVATAVVATNNTSVYVSWDLVDGATGYKVYGRTNGLNGLLGVVGGGTAYFIDRGVSAPNAQALPPQTQSFTDIFTLNVYDATASTVTPAESYTCSLNEQVDGMGRQLEVTQAVNAYSAYIQVESNAAAFAGVGVPTIFSIPKTALAAGASGSAVMSSDIMQGWDEFADPEKTDVRILINAGYAIPAVQLKMDSICFERGDSVAVLDVPSNAQQMQQAIDYRNIQLNLNSNRSALYTPDLLIEDQYSGKTLFVPPSGHVAGVYAKTDAVAYPWFAPAGLNRALLSVLGVRYQYDRGMRDALHRSQVNYIRSLQGFGRAVWEQRTLQSTTSGFSFVNVRRMFDFLALTIKRALYQKEFEPNDDILRREIRILIEQFLATVKSARGINKFLVICDIRNNPAFITAQGQLNVDVFVEPTLAAEKIRVRLNLTQQGVDFSELLANTSLV